jgi:hypothetical protein
MTIKITNIEYDLYDEETNPNNEITAEDFELPPTLVIEQKSIDKLYGEDFSVEADLHDLITCHTGFEPKKYNHEVIS